MLESVGFGEDLGSSGMPKYFVILKIFPQIGSFSMFCKVKAKANAMMLDSLLFFIIVSLYYTLLFCYEKNEVFLWRMNIDVELHFILWKKVHEKLILWDRTVILK